MATFKVTAAHSSNDLGPAVQNFVSLMASCMALRHQLFKENVDYIIKCTVMFAKDSHILSTKNNSVFVILILPFEILTNR